MATMRCSRDVGIGPRSRRGRWIIAAALVVVAGGVAIGRCARADHPPKPSAMRSPRQTVSVPHVRHGDVTRFTSAALPVPVLDSAPDAGDAGPDDRVSFVATSCDPDPRVLSLPERRWVPAELKQRVRDVLERSRQRSRAAVIERYAQVLDRAPPERASLDELAGALWAVLAPGDRARAAEAVGGGAAPGPQRLLGLDHMVAELAREPEQTLADLVAAIGAEAADRIWTAEALSWCAFALPL